jgi:hypothetical protein
MVFTPESQIPPFPDQEDHFHFMLNLSDSDASNVGPLGRHLEDPVIPSRVLGPS